MLNFTPDQMSRRTGRELDTVAPGALPSRQRRCSVDRWQSSSTRYGEAGPLQRIGAWSNNVASTGTG